jgi:cytochrome b
MKPFWDPWVRITHWSLVSIVILNAFILEDGGDWHELLGYAACAFVGARIVWGFVGSRNARFTEMLKGWPRGRLLVHLRDYLQDRTPRYLNHPPLAILVMSGMLACILGLGLTGWMMELDRFFGEEWVEEVHEVLSNSLLLLASAHLIGVLRASWLHRENLIASMFHGRKKLD